MRLILLIDMDYFFAACEELRDPSIKDKPVVVGADPKAGEGRGVVSTCNYIARKYGIHSAMPISQAYRLKKDAVFLPVDDKYYEETSAKVMAIIKRYAAKVEQVSIDEAFADISSNVDGYNGAVEYAAMIKKSIKEELGLPCSIGISANKLLAKMACTAAKPDGIKLVKDEDGKAFLSQMDVEKLYGIGEKTAEKLRAMGYKTVGELAKANQIKLIDAFGIWGAELYKNANGIDDSELVDNDVVKSIGRETTFEKDTSEVQAMKDAIRKMAEEVGKELQAKKFAFKVVTIKIRYSDFSEHLKSRSLRQHTDKVEDMASSAYFLIEKYAEKGRAVRKIGVRVSGLLAYKGQKKISSFVNYPRLKPVGFP